MNCVIVDIDGTLADTRHRLHYLAKMPKDWNGFYSEMSADTLHEYVADLTNAIATRYAILLVTGRPEDYRGVTAEWLRKNRVLHNGIFMRPSGDFRPDTAIKLEILDEILHRGYSVKFAIDDRPEVVKMWRDSKIPCLQVDDSPWYAPIKDNDDLVGWLEWMKSQHHDLMFQKCADELKRLQQLEDDAYHHGLERDLLG